MLQACENRSLECVGIDGSNENSLRNSLVYNPISYKDHLCRFRDIYQLVL